MIHLYFDPTGWWNAYLDPEPGSPRGSARTRAHAIGDLFMEYADLDREEEVLAVIKDKIKEDR